MTIGRSISFALLGFGAAGYCSTVMAQAAAPAPGVLAVGEGASAPVTNRLFGDHLDVGVVVLDKEDSDSLSLGIDYEGKWRKSFGPTAVDPNDPTTPRKGVPGTLDEDQPKLFGGYYDLSARGTLASSSAKTSNKLLDFSGQIGGEVDTKFAYFSAGGILTHEMDQSRDNKQTLYGINLSMTKILLLNRPSIFQGSGLTLQLGYGRVNPGKDTEREKILGKLDNYNRWNGELSYTMRLPSTRATGLVLSYRAYREVSAPNAIRQAGMDSHQLWYAKVFLNFKEQRFFVAYSDGALPFDQKDVRAIKVGWTSDWAEVFKK